MRFLGYLAEPSPQRGELTGLTYESPEVAYRIGELSPAWERIDVERGDIAFFNRELRATMTVDSTCREDASYTLRALSDSQVIGIRSKRELRRERLEVNGSQGLLVVWEGELDRVPIRIAGVVAKKAGCIFDFTYASSPAAFPSAFEEFLAFLDDFRVVQRK